MESGSYVITTKEEFERIGSECLHPNFHLSIYGTKDRPIFSGSFCRNGHLVRFHFVGESNTLPEECSDKDNVIPEECPDKDNELSAILKCHCRSFRADDDE